MDNNILQLRSNLLKAVREFFYSHDYLEVETPVRVKYPALELHIDAERSDDYYLRTSPELNMKKLLAAGAERIFEIGPCFRRGEKGRLHNPEYTMLEWYCTGMDYVLLLEFTQKLFRNLASVLIGNGVVRYNNRDINIAGEWDVFSVSDIFQRYAGWNPVTDFDADRFDLDLVEKIELALSRDVPVVLKDYPAPLAALSRLKPDNPAVAERWELYIGGMELVNVYSELTDSREQRLRFEECAKKRASLGKEVYKTDEEFLRVLDSVPECAGAALGIDRLVMLFGDIYDISQVINVE